MSYPAAVARSTMSGHTRTFAPSPPGSAATPARTICQSWPSWCARWVMGVRVLVLGNDSCGLQGLDSGLPQAVRVRGSNGADAPADPAPMGRPRLRGCPARHRVRGHRRGDPTGLYLVGSVYTDAYYGRMSIESPHSISRPLHALQSAHVLESLLDYPPACVLLLGLPDHLIEHAVGEILV